MQALAINNYDVIPATEFRSELFNDFISFVDRTENTARAYIINLRQFAAWMRYAAVVRPQREDIISYRNYLSAEHDAIQLDPETVSGWSYRTDRSGRRYTVKCSANTVKQYLQSVRQFFAWTACNNLYPNIAANIHAPKVRQDQHKKDAFTAPEVLDIERSILKVATDKEETAAGQRKDTQGRIDRATEQGKRLYAMYLLAVNCGLRTIELSRADIKDIETKGGISYLRVWGKGHSEADTRKALAPEVKAAVDDYLKSRTDSTAQSPLFVSTGNRSGGKRIAPTTISKMLKGAMISAGYNSNRLTAHSLRHTAGTCVMDITKDIYQTQQYMRHSNPATTEIYLHNDMEAAEATTAQNLYNYYHNDAL